MKYKDVVFICPYCGEKHKVKDWVEDCLNRGDALFDHGYTERSFLEGRCVVVRILGLCCSCNEEYSMTANDNGLSIRQGEELIWGTSLKG